jgi:hypothetical protein
MTAPDISEEAVSKFVEGLLDDRGNYIGDGEYRSKTVPDANIASAAMLRALRSALTLAESKLAASEALAVAKAEQHAKLVAAFRDLHSGMDCDPYERCDLCDLAEYT